jgi:predicted NBD/HSP70 family sugar kinase
VLRERGPTTRAELGTRTGLSRATVSSVIADLVGEGLAVEAEPAVDIVSPGQGRPPTLVRLNRAAGVGLGIDFGKRHLRVAAADLGHQVLAERAVPLAPDHEAAHGIEMAARLVDEVVREAEVSLDAIVGVGLGLPGPVRADTGELGSSTILPGWVGVRAEQAMSERLGLAVRVDNDANLGALAEWTWGAARGCSTVAYVKVSTGIGAGLIVAGAPFHGAGGTAGEIGHTIVDPSGPVCRCGNRGCLETLVGAPALLGLLAPSLGDISVQDLIERGEAGDMACRRVLADAGRAIGTAAANLVNLLNPERIVVGGDLGAAGELLLAPLRDALGQAAIPSAAGDAEVVAGVLGERAEVLGAIALGLRTSRMGFVAADVAA